MAELNPENPLLQRLHQDDLWMKLCAALVFRTAGCGAVRLGMNDFMMLQAEFAEQNPTLTIRVINKGTPQEMFELQIKPEAEALEMARRDPG